MHRSDFSDLNTLRAISDHLSFRAAAAQLGVTSPALSHSIRQLGERPPREAATSDAKSGKASQWLLKTNGAFFQIERCPGGAW
jgi:Bacterial regulatory helix-turn-helix protein, lysR family